MGLAGCASLRGRSAEGCAPSSPSRNTAPSLRQIDGLAGRFRLTQINTAFDDPPRVTEIALTRADSNQRIIASQRRLGHTPRADLRLVGTWHSSGNYPDEPVEWDSGVLYLSCRDCTDGSPDELQIVVADDVGFRGTWRNAQTGIVHAVDRRGRALPDPSGYFCATRIADPSP